MPRVPGDLWSPEEAIYFRRNSLLTSRSMSWKGVVVAHQHMAPGSYSTPAILSHSLSLHVAQPVLLTRTDEGKTQKGLLVCGDLHLSIAGQYPRWHHQEIADVLNIGVDPLFLHEIAEAMEVNNRRVELIPQFKTQDRVIRQVMLALVSELETSQIGSRIYIDALTTQLAVQLIRRYSTYKVDSHQADRHAVTPKFSKQQLRTIQEFIQANLENDISLAQLAAILYLSPYHFSRLFKQSTHLTPYQYILAQRIDRARHLIQTRKELSLQEIAVTVGFYDQSHLTRHMKRILGITPKELLKATH